jgi:hypothetical protein
MVSGAPIVEAERASAERHDLEEPAFEEVDHLILVREVAIGVRAADVD